MIWSPLPTTISSSKSRYTYVTEESFTKLSNLKAQFDISTRYDVFATVSWAKYVVYHWTTNQKVTMEKHVYFCLDCNINVYINCYYLLKTEQDMIGKKEELCKKFLSEENPKWKKSSIVQLSISLITAIWVFYLCSTCTVFLLCYFWLFFKVYSLISIKV